MLVNHCIWYPNKLFLYYNSNIPKNPLKLIIKNVKVDALNNPQIHKDFVSTKQWKTL